MLKNQQLSICEGFTVKGDITRIKFHGLVDSKDVLDHGVYAVILLRRLVNTTLSIKMTNKMNYLLTIQGISGNKT